MARKKKFTVKLRKDPPSRPGIGRRIEDIRWIFPLLVVLITWAAFAPVLRNGFINMDDPVSLLGNSHYRGLGWTQLQWMFTTFHNTLYRPVTWITLGADYLLWGMEPAGYHGTALLFHSANVLFFYFVALRILCLAANVEPSEAIAARVAAVFAALLFAVHPLRVEAVAWASGRNDVVAPLFLLAAVLCYLRSASPSENGAARRWLAATVIFYALSLLSKPSGITLPFVLLVLDVYPLRRLGGGPGKWFGSQARNVWREKLPLLFLAAGAGALALIGKQQSGLLASLAQYGLIERGMQSVCALAFYLWKTVLPIRLSVLYEMPVPMEFSSRLFVVSSIADAIIIAALYFFRRQWPAGLVSWICYFVILLPVTGIFQNGPQLAADRYAYLSCMPLAVLAGAAGFYGWRSYASGKISRRLFVSGGAFAMGSIVVLAGLTWRQTQVWRNSETLWQHALAVDAGSFLAHHFLATALFESGKSEAAIEHFRAALEINPGYASAYNNLANALARRGNSKEAVTYYRQAIKLEPASAEGHYNLARLLARRGDVVEAIAEYNEALRIDGADADSHNNLGLLLASQGDFDGANRHFNEALQIDPTYAKAHFNLARILLKQERIGDAVEHFRRAAELQPGVAEIHENFARALSQQGKREEALRHYEEAVRIMRAPGSR